MSVFVRQVFSRHIICIPSSDYYNIGSFKSGILLDKVPHDNVYIIKDGRLVSDNDPLQENAVYQIVPRMLGGKGGFGSMLRAIGAQIEKTTNREACRDLSGRRMRDVNNEKELKEWLAKQAERERERQQQKEERISRRRALQNHKFDDPKYDKQKSLVAENQMDALQTGLQKFQHKRLATATVTASSWDSSEEEQSRSLKRKNENEELDTSENKKLKTQTEWIGIDVENLSELESEEEKNERTDSNAASCDHSIDFGQDSTKSMSQNNIESQQDDESLSQSNKRMKKDTEHIIENRDKKHGIFLTVFQEQNGVNSTEGILQKKNNTLEGEVTDIESNKEGKASQDTGPIDLEAIGSPEELEALGLERLKAELMSRGIKCGGTIQERSKRLFSVKGLTPDQYDKSILAKPTNGNGKKDKRQ
ncbi:hypothetical protein CHS0354_034593 [Potamilus streckersoni]|uniref:Replication stress response regulator SDE2 n=1 Tax=Potamilus streckersoni TaxID=2493646 RepID=A0AAE0SSL3_9BIVA|nr:hypothetical protein CHS0354_034593 [Potamilus streckersoni]